MARIIAPRFTGIVVAAVLSAPPFMFDLKAQEQVPLASPVAHDKSVAPKAEVTKAWRFDPSNTKNRAQMTVRNSDILAIQVTNYAEWLRFYDKNCFDLRLFLDGRAVLGDEETASPERLEPEACDDETGVVKFPLEHTSAPSIWKPGVRWWLAGRTRTRSVTPSMSRSLPCS